MKPRVDDAQTRFTYGRPDVELLQRFCWDKFGWDQVSGGGAGRGGGGCALVHAEPWILIIGVVVREIWGARGCCEDIVQRLVIKNNGIWITTLGM